MGEERARPRQVPVHGDARAGVHTSAERLHGRRSRSSSGLLSTRTKETIMRHNVVYHASGMATMTGMRDSVMIGLHIEEGIYGELYLGFEGRQGLHEAIWKTRYSAEARMRCSAT